MSVVIFPSGGCPAALFPHTHTPPVTPSTFCSPIVLPSCHFIVIHYIHRQVLHWEWLSSKREIIPFFACLQDGCLWNKSKDTLFVSLGRWELELQFIVKCFCTHVHPFIIFQCDKTALCWDCQRVCVSVSVWVCVRCKCFAQTTGLFWEVSVSILETTDPACAKVRPLTSSLWLYDLLPMKLEKKSDRESKKNGLLIS